MGSNKTRDIPIIYDSQNSPLSVTLCYCINVHLGICVVPETSGHIRPIVAGIYTEYHRQHCMYDQKGCKMKPLKLFILFIFMKL